jgi:two-component system phosphate regulon response regulator PhoB
MMPSPQAPAFGQSPGGSGLSVLVVEDEEDLLDLLQFNLTREGFSVRTASTGEQALRAIRAQPPQLVLLDLMLPGIDGLEVCRAIKGEEKTASLPVIMLTARGEESDVVAGLELGADDYIAKPFSPRVLVARIHAVMRRLADDGGGDGSGRVVLRGVSIDPARHQVQADGTPVELTATEFRLLSLLMSRPGRVYTRQQIIESIHDGFAAVTDRSVDVQVVALRRKLMQQGRNIETVRGVGYRFRD